MRAKDTNRYEGPRVYTEKIFQDLEKLRKSIPKKGLNNRSRVWLMRPTLPDRVDKMRWATVQLFSRGVINNIGLKFSSKEEREKMKKLIVECYDLLSAFESNLNTVNVLDEKQLEEIRLRIGNVRDSIRMDMSKLGLLIEVRD